MTNADVHMLDHRAPSEAVSWLRSVAESSLAAFDVPTEAAVGVLGSIAEGFGNACSDIDVLVILPVGATFEVLASAPRRMLGYGDRRVEVFFWRAEDLVDLASRCKDHGDRLTAPELDLYQRIAYALPLRHAAAIRELQLHFDRGWLANLRAEREAHAANRWFQRAALMLALGRALDAVELGRRAVEHAAKHWACRRGETYSSRKFLARQLRRGGLDRAVLQRLTRVLAALDREAGLPSLATMAELCASLGVDVPDPEDVEPASVQFRAGTDRLRVGEHFIASRDACLVAIHDAGGELSEALSSGELRVPSADRGLDRAVAALHRAGLMELVVGEQAWPDDRPCAPRGRVRVTSTGIESSDDIAVVAGASVRTIVQAGVDLVVHAFEVENGGEDAIGALRRRDWDTLAFVLEHLVYRHAAILLSRDLVVPAPDRHELLEALATRNDLAAAAQLVEHARTLSIEGLDDARRYYEVIKRIRALRPRDVISRHFRGCHDSAVAWAKLLAYVFRPWAEIAQVIPVTVPGDMLEFFQIALDEHSLLTDEALDQQRRWHRRLDLDEELSKDAP